MFKRVASLWEIRDIDQLDPLVKLMIESLAGEIFRLTGEYRHIENRLLEKLAQTLTPASLMPALPAHAIMQAKPSCPELLIDSTTEFQYKNGQFLKRHDLKRLPFTPTASHKLVDGAVRFLVDATGCYALDEFANKELLARSRHRHPDMNQTIWLALELNPEIVSLKNFCFYIDFPHVENKADFFQLLPFSVWETSAERLMMKPGNDTSINDFHQFDLRQRLNNLVNEHYQHRFMTVTQHAGCNATIQTPFPNILKHLFDESVPKHFTNPLTWIKISFPPAFNQDVLCDIGIHLNAFPVANKYLHSLERKVNELTPVIPLSKDDNEYLLDIHAVSDANGTIYCRIPDNQSSDKPMRTFALRRGGCERFDTSDARDILDRLTDLLRDESMAFANVDKDSLGQNALNLLKQLNQLEHKTNRKKNASEPLSYIIPDVDLLEPLSFFVEYWLTNGQLANDIRAGETLTPSKLIDIDRATARLLTTTRGGAPAPDNQQRIHLFKHALTASDAIYTHHDIRTFCMAHYLNLIRHVDVTRGVTVSKIPNQGLIRTIDVIVTPHNNLTPNDIHALSEDLMAALKSRSPDTFQYRVIINL